MKVFFINTKDGFSDMYETMLSDVLISKESELLLYSLEEKNILKIFSKKSFRKLSLNLFDNFYYRKYLLSKKLQSPCSHEDKVSIVFFNPAFDDVHYNIDYLKWLKSKYKNIHLYVYYVDSCNADYVGMCNYIINNSSNLFDQIFTMDYNDSINKGYTFYPTLYSRFSHKINNKYCEYNLYFCGGEKNRKDLLVNILKKLYLNNIDYNFQIAMDHVDSSTYSFFKGVNYYDYNNLKTYKEIISEICCTNCILDLVGVDGQSGFSLRVYEAVCYNKKLLTNNPNIYQFKYYNPLYMKFFDSLDEIDFEWIKKNEEIDYKYNDEFSPKNFINYLELLG